MYIIILYSSYYCAVVIFGNHAHTSPLPLCVFVCVTCTLAALLELVLAALEPIHATTSTKHKHSKHKHSNEHGGRDIRHWMTQELTLRDRRSWVKILGEDPGALLVLSTC